jgi:hypothetical protein
MSDKNDLVDIERSALKAIRSDGLETVGFGIFIAVLAVFIYDIRYGGITGLGILGYFLIPLVLRKYITYPRVGYAKFIEKKNARRIITSALIVILCLSLFYILGKNERFGFLMPLFLGLLFSVFMFWQAYRTRLAINYILGTVFLAAGNIGFCFTMTGSGARIVTGSILSILAFITITAGVSQSIWFIRKYPLTPAEGINGR